VGESGIDLRGILLLTYIPHSINLYPNYDKSESGPLTESISTAVYRGRNGWLEPVVGWPEEDVVRVRPVYGVIQKLRSRICVVVYDLVDDEHR
jgi:hypothetical protein